MFEENYLLRVNLKIRNCTVFALADSRAKVHLYH